MKDNQDGKKCRHQKGVTRRKFMTELGSGTMAVAAAGTLGGCQTGFRPR